MAEAGSAQLDGWIEHLGAALRADFAAHLRDGRSVQAPTVHMLCADLDPPYLGFVECRLFGPGSDGAGAVAALGLLPAAVRAARLLVCWDYLDMARALGEPGATHGPPSALMLLDAGPRGHSLVRHDVWRPWGPISSQGVVEPSQDAVSAEPGATLPDPVRRLLAVWRDGGGGGSGTEVARVCAALEHAGYRMRWVPKSAPSWARALAPLMR